MKTHAIVLFRIYPGLEGGSSCADSWIVQLLGSPCADGWSVQLHDFLASLPESPCADSQFVQLLEGACADSLCVQLLGPLSVLCGSVTIMQGAAGVGMPEACSAKSESTLV